MNRLLLYKDVPRVFDAWDIDSNYEQQFVESGRCTGIRVAEESPAVPLRSSERSATPP